MSEEATRKSKARFEVAILDEALEPRIASLSAGENWLGHPDAGSLLWFHGVTRRTTIAGDQTTVTRQLSYTAHRSMAEYQLQLIAKESIQAFALHRVLIWHRLGMVPIGQSSVIVGCSSAHRVESFNAIAMIMNRIKKDVPIWKQEHFENGERQWIHPSPARTGDG